MGLIRSELLALLAVACFAISQFAVAEENSLLEIRRIEVNGKPVVFEQDKELNTGAFPQDVTIYFGVAPQVTRPVLRVRSRMDGADTAWREGGGQMFFVVRFFDGSGNRLQQESYSVSGDSKGWYGAVTNSEFTHRRETITVPPRAAGVMVVISSAGPSTTTGIYVVSDLCLSRALPGGQLQSLLRPSFLPAHGDDLQGSAPRDWVRDGTQPDMARIVATGRSDQPVAFAIVDDNRFSHAEWHNVEVIDPKVSPGDQLVMEWNEMYSIGEADGRPNVPDLSRSETFGNLQPGRYRFRLAEATIYGEPVGIETTLSIRVPRATWQSVWFWVLVACFGGALSALLIRFAARRKLRQTILEFQHRRAVEQERLRIAQDLKESLGAPASEISMLSAAAQTDSTLSDSTREQFGRIAGMSRDLVSTFNQTVWTVDPKNDNLDAVIKYLRDWVTEFCNQAHLRCATSIPELPRAVNVSSGKRHNICMVVNEAVQNAVKHAVASSLCVNVEFFDSSLNICIQDDGRGFDLSKPGVGNGLNNMRRRMNDIGGSCEIQTAPGQGTKVWVRLQIENEIVENIDEDLHSSRMQNLA